MIRPALLSGRSLVAPSLLCLSLSLMMGCATAPKPSGLTAAEATRQHQSMAEVTKFAPDAVAEGDQALRNANAAYAEGKTARAQILGELAAASYEEARAVARLVRAETRRVRDMHTADELNKRLDDIKKGQREVDADVASLEKEIRALRDAQLPLSSKAGSAAREVARRKVVDGLHLQAILLCRAAEAATGQNKAKVRPSLTAAVSQLAALRKMLAQDPAVAPIDQAGEAKAACLGALTQARPRAASESLRIDELRSALAESLSKAPANVAGVRRSAHGLTVTINNPFTGNKLKPKAKEVLANVMTLVRTKGALSVASWHDSAATKVRLARIEVLAGIVAGPMVLSDLPSPSSWTKFVVDAAERRPLVDPKGKYAARNVRLELLLLPKAVE